MITFLLYWFFKLLNIAIIIRVIISFVNVNKNNEFIKVIFYITEPILAPIRSFMEKISITKNVMIDVSPLIALLLINLLRNILI